MEGEGSKRKASVFLGNEIEIGVQERLGHDQSGVPPTAQCPTQKSILCSTNPSSRILADKP